MRPHELGQHLESLNALVNPVTLPLFDMSPVDVASQLNPLELRQVRRTSEELLVQSLLEAHHYLGYTRAISEDTLKSNVRELDTDGGEQPFEKQEDVLPRIY